MCAGAWGCSSEATGREARLGRRHVHGPALCPGRTARSVLAAVSGPAWRRPTRVCRAPRSLRVEAMRTCRARDGGDRAEGGNALGRQPAQHAATATNGDPGSSPLRGGDPGQALLHSGLGLPGSETRGSPLGSKACLSRRRGWVAGTEQAVPAPRERPGPPWVPGYRLASGGGSLPPLGDRKLI